MKKKNIEELIIDYIDGNLDFEILREELLKSDEYKERIEEIYGMKAFYEKLDEVPAPEPTENLDKTFYNMLEPMKSIIVPEKHSFGKIIQYIKSIASYITLPKLGYSAALLVIGILAGKLILPGSNEQLVQMSAEVKEMKQVLMLTMLNQPAASERIKAVNYVNSISEVNNKVVNALLETLNSDPDVNVRLATVDALSEFTGNPQVRQGMIMSITKQTSPLVQVALAELMVSLKEKKSIEPLKKLLEDKEIIYTVKTKIEDCIAKI